MSSHNVGVSLLCDSIDVFSIIFHLLAQLREYQYEKSLNEVN